MNELAAIFTPQQVQTIIGISPQRLVYWHRAGLLTPRYYDEAGLFRLKRLYSFRDLVTARTILILRVTYKLSLQELRMANEVLQAHYEEPWASLRFWVLGSELLYKEPSSDVIVSASRRGQQIFPIDVGQVEVALRSEVETYRRRKPEDIGSIRRDRLIMGNAYCIAGTRIPVSTIYGFHAAGYSDEQINEEYPDLDPRDIQAAIADETVRRARTA